MKVGNIALIAGSVFVALACLAIVVGAPEQGKPSQPSTAVKDTSSDRQPGAVPPASVAVLAAFPNTVVRYYNVPGTDAAAIRAYMNANGPVDPHDHSTGDASAHWRINWRYPKTNDVCHPAGAQLTFSGDVLLPRLRDAAGLSPTVRDDWNRYMAALIIHEAGHLRHAYNHMNDVAAAVRKSTCADANAAGMQAIAVLGQYDAEYDRATRHGREQGVAFPVRH